jgi:pimeloyl-ACP methyl ester carboxylesterase
MKLVIRLAALLIGLVLLTAVGALSYRAWWQHRIAGETRITSPNGIAVARFVDVHGAQQWITIRGQDGTKPVIFFLHGGPSEANSPFVHLFQPFEKDFVFVQWDQPGAGKTFIRSGGHQSKLTLEGIAADGEAIADQVRNEMHVRQIILVGQDWGGLVGLRMIADRPDLFEAFVGTGQVVSWLGEQDAQYAFTKNHAEATHDQKTLDALAQIGPPPYRSLERYRAFGNYFDPVRPAEDIAAQDMLRAALVFSPDLSLGEISGWVKALRTGEKSLTPILMQTDLRAANTVFSVPVFFIEGEDDIITPTDLVKDYLAKVQAPVKKLDVVPHASHMVMWQHPDEFITLLQTDMQLAQASRLTQ